MKKYLLEVMPLNNGPSYSLIIKAKRVVIKTGSFIFVNDEESDTINDIVAVYPTSCTVIESVETIEE